MVFLKSGMIKVIFFKISPLLTVKLRHVTLDLLINRKIFAKK